MTATYLRNLRKRTLANTKKPRVVDPRAKSALWRVRRALRQFRAARWDDEQASEALAKEGLTPTVIGQELDKRRVTHEANVVKRAGIEQRKRERLENRNAREAAKAERKSAREARRAA